MHSKYRIAVDVGGTFIDTVLYDNETGQFSFEKQPSTPDHLAEELLTAIERMPVKLDKAGLFFHGTTAATNAVVQERGAKIGLITNRGFRDVLALARGGRPEMFNLLYIGPQPLVPRYLRREVAGRLGPGGEEIEALSLDDLQNEGQYLVDQDVEAIALCFLHAYLNPTHERVAANCLRKLFPDVSITASHEVCTEWREYERTSTTVINAYLQPLFRDYVDDLATRLKQGGYDGTLAIMQSNGGVMSAENAARYPVRTLMSGPAGGVTASYALVKQLGFDNVICCDVGGTTFDVALLDRGRVIEKNSITVSERPIIGSTIDITSIGAGGGSIAWIDDTGGLRVGPQSAGVLPGPVCFGKGGREPTVTDAQLVLGWLDAEYFCDGRMKLDTGAAVQALSAHIAEPLGITMEQAADGILTIVQNNMTYAIREMTVERGLDPREFVMMAYGGGGGLFAVPIAEELGVKTIVLPRAAALFSAWGILSSDYQEDAAVTTVGLLSAKSVHACIVTLKDLREQVFSAIQEYGFQQQEVACNFRADFRYLGQEHALTVPLEEEWLQSETELIAGATSRFVAMHRELYGYGEPDQPIEFVAMRCRAVGRVPRIEISTLERGETVKPRTVGQAYCRQVGGHVETPRYDRRLLATDQVIEGPAIIEEAVMTTIILPGWHAQPDQYGNLLLTN